MEHRWGQRLPVRARVALRAQGGSRGIGYICDISVSGALLSSGVHASLMSFVRVSLPGVSSGSTSIDGQVVRHTDGGFAVEWCELAPDIVRALTQRERSVDMPVERDAEEVAMSGSARLRSTRSLRGQ